uniref:Uncharacterized protein n=1 Tax=Oryza brachyantha TaxID=4533 RepID=A0A1V1H6Q8_ORYBR|nr:hypothetical protein [Oryza brachyantha]
MVLSKWRRICSPALAAATHTRHLRRSPAVPFRDSDDGGRPLIDIISSSHVNDWSSEESDH